jgi:tetratricopeptide (TPR) repeat protein
LQVRMDSTGSTEHIRSILQLKDILQKNKSDGLNFSYGYYKNDNHGSVPLITEYDGLRFIFSYYKTSNKINNDMFDPHSGADVAAELSEHYADISKHMGYKVLPPEEDINSLGYYLMNNKQPQKAYQLFELNVRNYPHSENAFDSMGDYFAAQKNKAKAIDYYTKALAIADNADTKKKLDSLQGKK